MPRLLRLAISAMMGSVVCAAVLVALQALADVSTGSLGDTFAIVWLVWASCDRVDAFLWGRTRDMEATDV